MPDGDTTRDRLDLAIATWLEESLENYAHECAKSDLPIYSADTYVNGARWFVRWFRGECRPGTEPFYPHLIEVSADSYSRHADLRARVRKLIEQPFPIPSNPMEEEFNDIVAGMRLRIRCDARLSEAVHEFAVECQESDWDYDTKLKHIAAAFEFSRWVRWGTVGT